MPPSIGHGYGYSMILTYFVLGMFVLAACLGAARLGRWLGVMDLPDGVRKVHPGPVPMVGGFAVAVPVVLMAEPSKFRSKVIMQLRLEILKAA